MQLQEQFDDVFRQAGDLPGAPRRRNFGAKPKLWDTWISPDDLQNNPANELVDIKVRYNRPSLKPLIFILVLPPIATLCFCRSARCKDHNFEFYITKDTVSRTPKRAIRSIHGHPLRQPATSASIRKRLSWKRTTILV